MYNKTSIRIGFRDIRLDLDYSGYQANIIH